MLVSVDSITIFISVVAFLTKDKQIIFYTRYRKELMKKIVYGYVIVQDENLQNLYDNNKKPLQLLRLSKR